MIPITKPYFGSEEIAAIRRPLESGWVVQGPHVAEFESKVARFVGASHAVATTSCTTALHLAVVALDVRPGDEVIVPAFTWVTTPNVIEYTDARPVFCDIDPHTFNIDVGRAAKLVNAKTVGIVPVHAFGLCSDMPPLLELATQDNLWIVEDAACALGSRIGERTAGTFGAMACFSFHPRKCVTTGEGGMVTTHSGPLAARVRSLRNHGATAPAAHEPTHPCLLGEFDDLGFNYRMTDIQGALGSAQMDRVSWLLGERTKRAQRYDAALREIGWLRTPPVPASYTHTYQSYVCWFAPESPNLSNVERLSADRNRVMRQLDKLGVATRPGTHAPPFTSWYIRKYGYRPEDFPVAYMAERLTIALPLFPQMTDDEQDVVLRALRQAF